MTTRIRTNLNRYSDGYANAQPRLQAGLNNIAAIIARVGHALTELGGPIEGKDNATN